MHVLSRSALSALAISAIAAPPLAAQRAVPATYAITNARIVPVSSATIEKGTIVIRDGLSVAVGANASVPADARIVDGTGHTVYPGLIDAYGSLGLPAQTTGGGGGGGGGGGFGAPAAAAPAGAPNSRYPVGLRPEVRAIDQLIEDADFSGPYGAGITTALTAPVGRIYEGQSALINLAGGDYGAAVLRPAVALHIGFQGIGGGQFPGSLMGVFAALRQSFLDAQRYRDMNAAYARAPRSMVRPAYDPSLEALQPVIAGTMPVVFRASTQREIERALDLAKEFKLKAIIGGGSESYLVADRLKADNVPVLLSLNFPRVTTAPAVDAEPEPLRVLRGRVQAPKTPGQIAQAGVRFAFQSGGGNASDFLGNVRRAVAGGLSQDQALRALTIGSAEILGAADRIGSLEVGKIANLAVVRGDLFAADGRVTSVYIDGRPHTVAAPAATLAAGRNGAAGRPGSSLEGAWTFAVEFDGVEHHATLQLRSVDDRLLGTLLGDLGSSDVTDIRVGDDDEVAFSATVTLPEGTEEAWFRGTLTNGVFSGRVEVVGHSNGRFAGRRDAFTDRTDMARQRQER